MHVFVEMFSCFSEIEGQSLLTADSVSVTPQKSVRTPLKVIGGQLLNRHEARTPNSGFRGKAYVSSTVYSTAENMNIGSPCFTGTPCSKSVNKPGMCTPSNISQRTSHKQKVYNPFDAALIERLQSPIFSPSVFSHTKTPASCKTPTFRWNIDELALLKPVNFDELQDGMTSFESDVEAHAQAAIDKFFAHNNVIVPSPQTSEQCHLHSGNKWKNRQNATDILQHTGNSEHLFRVSEEKLPEVADAACQTTLTLPVDFALDKLLADFYTFNSTNDDIAELSNSSLRRKLFSNIDDSSFNLPYLSEVMDIKATPSGISPHVSPVRGCRTPDRGSSKTISVHASGYFSSSPIRNLQKAGAMSCESAGTIRRSSTAPRLIDSPSLSPLEKCLPANITESSLVSPLNLPQDTKANSLSGSILIAMTPGLSPITAIVDEIGVTPSPSDLCKRQIVKLPVPFNLWEDDKAEVNSASEESTKNLQLVADVSVQKPEATLWLCQSSREDSAACSTMTLPLNSQQESGFQSAMISGNSIAIVERSSTTNLTNQFQHLRPDTPDAGIEVIVSENKEQLWTGGDSCETRMSVLEASITSADIMVDNQFTSAWACFREQANYSGKDNAGSNRCLVSDENMSFDQYWE